jgi:uncharacterized protein with HEPN domain
VKAGRETSEVNLSRAIDHLRAAIKYSDRGRDVFFDEAVPDTYLLVEGELRKAFESLNRLGQSFFAKNHQLDRDRIGEIRQLLTHDYSDVDREVVWAIQRDDAARTLRILLRAKIPPGD